MACYFIVNKLPATDSSISPGLINKVDSIYISVPWFRFTLMDLILRVLFHRHQTIVDRILKTDISVVTGSNQIQLFPRLTSQSLGDRVRDI